MDPSALTAFLAPCLGFLLASGKAAGDRAADSLGTQVWEHAQRLWARLRPSIVSRPAAEEAARDLGEHPDDEQARAALGWQLRKALDADPALAADVEELWGQARTAGVIAGGQRSVAVGGDLAHSTVITGDHNRLGGGA
jgi:hypothetical protein